MPTAEEIRGLVGRMVAVRLVSEATGVDSVRGRLLGTLDAADGLVVTIEPADTPGKRLTYHYHHILDIMPEEG